MFDPIIAVIIVLFFVLTLCLYNAKTERELLRDEIASLNRRLKRKDELLDAAYGRGKVHKFPKGGRQ